MSSAATPRPPEPTARRLAEHPAWRLVLLALAAYQAWMTLGLFGPGRPWRRVLDADPIVSGRHPLHLYHGFLGARSLCERGTSSAYDPAFQAGCPKTPVFDSGSRPAELMLALGGGRFRPQAYKIGLALLCVSVPLILALAARGTGLSLVATCAATGIGVLVWWGRPARDALEAGDVDLLFATLFAVVQFGLLVRYHNKPGPASLVGIVAAGVLGWFAHPLLLALLLPLFMIYYLTVGTRHPWFWHAGLLPGFLAAVAANAFWLLDILQHWWILLPLQIDMVRLPHRTFTTVWNAPLWGPPLDRALGCAVLLLAAAGAIVHNQTKQRPAARLFGLAFAGFFLLATASLLEETTGRLGAARLLAPALLFAALPAGHGAAEVLRWVRHGAGWGGVAAVPVALVGLALLAAPDAAAAWLSRYRAPEALQIGLGDDRRALVELLAEHTTPDARILWEDRPCSRLTSRWTALLPLLTERAYVGGLDPDGSIEHTARGLVDDTLGGRPLKEWKDDELLEYCERYNIGWVVCWSPAARERFAAWELAERTAALHDEGDGCLFAVRRKATYALRGTAKWVAADSQRIVLEDVRPQDGQVLLSLHYQDGLRVTPGRIRLERAEDKSASDPIDFVRLLVADPLVTRVTITWEKPLNDAVNFSARPVMKNTSPRPNNR
jgi:hypothetical protein